MLQPHSNQGVEATQEGSTVVDEPDFVIKRKRRRPRKSAIDPCLGYYMNTPTPPALSLPVVDWRFLESDPASCKTTLPDSHSQPTYPPAAVRSNPSDSDLLVLSGPTEDQITVEAFLRWSAAADSAARSSTRKKRKYAILSETAASPSLPQRTAPPVRRYKKRRWTQHNAKTEERPPAVRGKAVRIRTRAQSGADTRRPIVFSSSQTPPGTPQPKKWRLVDPRTTAVQMLAMVGEKGQLKPELPLRETHFSSWRLDVAAQRVKPGIRRDATPAPQLEDPCETVARLAFIPLEEHEKRVASMFKATAPTNGVPGSMLQYSENSKRSPSKTELPLSGLPIPTITHITNLSEAATSTQTVHTEPMPCNGTPVFRRTQARKRDCLRPCPAASTGPSRPLQDQSVSLIQRASVVNATSMIDQTTRSSRPVRSFLGSLAQTGSRATSPPSKSLDAITRRDARDQSQVEYPSGDTSQEAAGFLLSSVPISSGWMFRSDPPPGPDSKYCDPGDSLSTMLQKRKPRYALSQLRKPSYLPGPATAS